MAHQMKIFCVFSVEGGLVRHPGLLQNEIGREMNSNMVVVVCGSSLKEGPSSPPKNPLPSSAGNLVGKVPFGFLQKAWLDNSCREEKVHTTTVETPPFFFFQV